MGYRNQKIDRDTIKEAGYRLNEEQEPQKIFRDTSLKVPSSLPTYTPDLRVNDAIVSKLVSLEDVSYNTLLSSSNTHKISNGYITINSFHSATGDVSYAYRIPLDQDYSGAHSTNKATMYGSDGTLLSGGDTDFTYIGEVGGTGNWNTEQDFTYIDRIEVGIMISGILEANAIHEDQHFQFAVTTGNLEDASGMNTHSSNFLSDGGLQEDFFQSGGVFQAGYDDLEQETKYKTRAHSYFHPISTTIADYDEKYFELYDGIGGHCKYIFDKDTSGVIVSGGDTCTIGISACTTVANIANQVKLGIKAASVTQSYCRLLATGDGDYLYIGPMKVGAQGNQPIITDLTDGIAKFNRTTTPGDDTANVFSGGEDSNLVATLGHTYDPGFGTYQPMTDGRNDNILELHGDSDRSIVST